MALKEGLLLLTDIGLLDVILPFILIFTITFAILQKTKVLGEEDKKPKKKLNAMIAFVMGFFAVVAANVLNIINIAIFYFVLILIIGLMVALIFGITGTIRNKAFATIMIGVILLFLFFGLVQTDVMEKTDFWKFVIVVLILGVLLFALHNWFAKKEKKPTVKPEKKVSAEKEEEI